MNVAAPMAPLPERAIHLLYVPTLCCNLSCSYCYLGKQTSEAALKRDAERAVHTLRHTLDALRDVRGAGVQRVIARRRGHHAAARGARCAVRHGARALPRTFRRAL